MYLLLKQHSQTDKIPFIGPTTFPKFWGKNPKATTKVTQRATNEVADVLAPGFLNQVTSIILWYCLYQSFVYRNISPRWPPNRSNFWIERQIFENISLFVWTHWVPVLKARWRLPWMCKLGYPLLGCYTCKEWSPDSLLMLRLHNVRPQTFRFSYIFRTFESVYWVVWNVLIF